MPVSPIFEWLARTEVATAINQSPYLMGLLSSVHLLGLTLIVGSAFVSCLRCLGFLLPEQPLSDVGVVDRLEPLARLELRGQQHLLR